MLNPPKVIKDKPLESLTRSNLIICGKNKSALINNPKLNNISIMFFTISIVDKHGT